MPVTRTLAGLALAPVAGVGGFYLGAFASRLVAQLLFYAFTIAGLVLHLLGVSTPAALLPSALLDPVRRADAVLLGCGAIGAVAALTAVVRVVARSSRAWRSGGIAVAGVLMAAIGAGAVDAYYGVTPYVETICPTSRSSTSSAG